MPESPPAFDQPRQRTWWLFAKVLLAFLLLNFLVTFVNVWPTPWVQPEARIAPEIVALWLTLLAFVAFFGAVSRLALGALTTFVVLLAVGRYADVTVPAILGRKMNLYWDAYHLPRFLDVASQALAWWQIIGIALAAVAGVWLLVKLIRLSIGVLAEFAAPYALRSPIAWLLTLASAGIVAADFMRVPAASPYVAGPVLPVRMVLSLIHI